MAAGIAVALAASVANAFAVVLQAAEDRRSPLAEGARAALLFRLARRRRWLAGTGLMVLAWPLQILALALAPITVVQPTLASTQLVLLGVARVKLGERAGPLEAFGAVAIVAGIVAVVWAAPRHTNHDPATARVAAPLLAVGTGALVAYAVGRLRPRATLALVIGAGLAYAWVDFANKLLANDLATARWALALGWLAATLAFGALAFLEETTALQRRPAITVSPVVGAVQDPLPVLMALWAGAETWSAGSQRIAPLIGGLAMVTAGAAILGRSDAVARASGESHPAAGSRRRRLAGCAPSRAAAR
jgi:drug/metabolite transporter (DMT)-like permease